MHQSPFIGLQRLLPPLIDTAYNFYIGSIIETPSAVVTSAAGIVTLTVQKSGGGNLTMLFDTGPLIFIGPKTLALTFGSDISPQINYVYVLKSAPTVLTKSTSSFPAATEFIPIGTFVVQSAATVATYGCYKVHLWTDHIWEGTASDGHLQHLNRWIRNQPATWESGTLCTPTLTGGSPDTLTIAIAAGIVLQLHDHDYPAFDSVGGGTTNLTTFFMPNHDTAYTPGKDLFNFTEDSSGNSASTNDRVIWVVWGVVSQDAGDCKVFINLPDDFYNTDAGAIADDSRFGVYNIPTEYQGTGFLIAKLVYKYSVAGGGTLTLVENRDLRGSFPNHVAGGSVAGPTVFPDNAFAVQNTLDPTKELQVDAGGNTAGAVSTLVTRSAADVDYTFPIQESSLLGTTTDGAATRTLVGGGSGVLPFWTTDITVSTDGEVTMPKQPAFLAFAVLQSNVTGDGAAYTVVFDSEVFDQASNFDGTSTFTAPITGKYTLNAHVQLIGMNVLTIDKIDISIVTSNRTYTSTKWRLNSFVYQFSDVEDSMLLTVSVADMEAADTAHVVITVTGEAGDTIDVSTQSYFSAVLRV